MMSEAFYQSSLTGAQLDEALSKVGNTLSLTGGALTGDLEMTGNRITGLGDPLLDTDGVNVQYLRSNYGQAIEDKDFPGCYYKMVGDVKEWINPPMVPGNEYRTTQRYNGVPVYTKLIALGEMPASGSKGVSFGGTKGLLSYKAFANNGTYWQEFPFFNNQGGISAKAFGSANWVGVLALGNPSSYTAIIIVEYLK